MGTQRNDPFAMTVVSAEVVGPLVLTAKIALEMAVRSALTDIQNPEAGLAATAITQIRVTYSNE